MRAIKLIGMSLIGVAALAFVVAILFVGGEFFIRALAHERGFLWALLFADGAAPEAVAPRPYDYGDSFTLLAGGLGTILLYYLVVWWFVGRDPAPGTSVPLFTPPEGLSPAAVRYVARLGYDEKTIAAELVSLAVNGYAKIVRRGSGDYMLQQMGGGAPGLTRAERYLASTLFKGGNRVALNKSDGARLRIATEQLQKHLEEEFDGPVFQRNIWAVALGVVISGAVLVGVAALHPGETLEAARITTPAMLLLLFPMNWLFFRLMKAPTALGRELMDRIEGFRMFLATAEHERFRRVDAPAMMPALYARYLPYAIALDLEQEWTDRFAGIIEASIPATDDFGWYAQTSESVHDMGFVGMVRSLGAAVAEIMRGKEKSGAPHEAR